MRPILYILLSTFPFLCTFSQEKSDRSIIEIVDSIINDENCITLEFEDGSYYFGQLADSIISGYGAMVYSDGTIYKGQWKNDAWHGNGYLSYPDGDTYEGGFRYQVIEGYGVYRYSDGSYYEGDWVNGMYNGQGTFHYTDGGLYTGTWEDDIRHGLGTLISIEDNKVYSGYFFRDEYLGPSKELFDELCKGERIKEQEAIKQNIKPSPLLMMELSYSTKFLFGINWGMLVEKNYLGITCDVATSSPFKGEEAQTTDAAGEYWAVAGWDEYPADEKTKGSLTMFRADFNYGRLIKEKFILGAGFGFSLAYEYKNCICQGPPYGCPSFNQGDYYYKAQYDKGFLDFNVFAKYRKELSHSTYAIGGISISKEAGLTFSLGLAF